ncbi:CDP-glycerol glycerophosphotransferase family protein [Quadrisphaera sp. DSM 44207]|uniref:CDP-glycerol glycerophosphotransferase family protein n=1 Tax=Quadrisphaera sp. DSM 44207 TaxID=1881057 RepID=UPI00087FFD26|nr:CDP-glycerol glycerophosphotransferase family protein [Quadrisphaera sp. DSM 44207]SDQ19280.1 CDP-glycerol glycerophosphotransferase [Quadrisphaera sp. DSM 44207]
MRIVWNSFNGRCSDSPLALCEALLARGDRAEHVWLADPRWGGAFPDGVRTVRIGSDEAVAALESADVLVSNTHIQLDEWRKAPGTTYLQTWHGTPLKRIHRDAAHLPEAAVLATLDEDIARWDHLVSPSAEATRLLRAAFRYDGDVLETGYPRNDVLNAPDRDARRARVRAELGVPDGTTAVLYAPTWRDDEATGDDDVPLGLDVPALADRLGDGHVLLLRLHHYMHHQRRPAESTTVRDVSAHPDISALYLAADVLVTDYSSAVFDFAVTGKPVVLFTYDLEHYRDCLRGFYLDLQAEAPGPLVPTQEELAAALLDLPAVAAAHADRYARFVDRYCHLDDGRASERVLAAVWPR